MQKKTAIISIGVTAFLVVSIVGFNVIVNMSRASAAQQNVQGAIVDIHAKMISSTSMPRVQPTSTSKKTTPQATPMASSNGQASTATPVPQAQTTSNGSTTPTTAGNGSASSSTGAAGAVTYRYFPVGTDVATMRAGSQALTKQQVKALIEKEVDGTWSVVQSQLGFSSKTQAYAFFLGQATRESTLTADLETGSGSAHSYGPLQASETAYANANPSYIPESDVPQLTMFDYTPQNFYDPGISVYMGIRHLIHFAHQAQSAGYTGADVLRHALMGYNTGYINTSNASWMTQYSDEIGALAGWYLNNGHLYDNTFTWTGDTRVDRSQPWGWY
jgi:hypothetical protein